MAACPKMSLEWIDAHADRERVAAIWQELTAHGAPSYFLSWSWIENWLAMIPPSLNVQMACFRENGHPALACLLTRTPFVRQGIFRGRALALHETGNWDYDSLYVEYNGFVGKAEKAPAVLPLLGSLPEPWHEIELSGVDIEAFPGREILEESGPFNVQILQQRHAHFIDLEAVRAKKDYLSLLSANTRSQIRRSERLYADTHGPIQFEVAQDLQQAREIYDEMVDMHVRSWHQRDRESHFVRPWIQQFHQRLIVQRFPYGEIQLIRVKAGAHTIGCLYNFVHQGRVYFYQGGLAQEFDNKFKPGMVCHAAAVQYCAAQGLNDYDFLAGSEQYKERMSTGKRTIAWLRVQRPLLRFKAEQTARRWALAAQARWEDWKKQRAAAAAAAQPQEVSS